MRFHTPSSPPPYFNRRDQRRLLGLVALLCLILVAARFSSRAKYWHWLIPPSGNSSRAPTSSQSSESTEQAPMKAGELKPDEFRVTPDTSSAALNDASSREGALPGDDSHPQPETTIGPQYVIRPQLLTEVRDSRLGLRHSEAEAYFAVLATIRELSSKISDRVALQGVTYTAMMASPAHYRGRLIQLRGEIKRVSPFPASENTHGINDLYDVWFLTNQSGDKPLHARCTHMPSGLVAAVRRGESVQARITGYFFRIEAYSAVGGIRTAPLILSRSLYWIRPPDETRSQRGLVPYVIGFVTIVSLASGLTLWMYKRSDKAFEHSQLKRLSEPEAPVIDALQDLDITDPRDLFREWSSPPDDAPHGEE